MTFTTGRLASILACGLLAATAAHAHHSIVGEFDVSPEAEVALRGAVKEVEWFNPHIWITLDVTRDDGNVEEWQCELGSPNSLIRLGWKKDDLPPGTVIRTIGNPARDGSNTCSTRSVTLDDGTPVFSRTGRP